MYRIDLLGMKLKVYLGVHDFERSCTQSVKLNLTFKFLSMPKGCVSDSINDVMCYDKIARSVYNFTMNKSYRLIEHLAFELLNYLKSLLNIPVDISLNVIKCINSKYINLAKFCIDYKWQK